MKRLTCGLALALLAVWGSFGQQPKTVTAPRALGSIVESLPLHLHLAGLRGAAGPEILEGNLVLSAAGPFRFVGAAFEQEGFAVIHPFDRNAQGVFVLALPLPPGPATELAYRLVVDGVWMADPANPRHRLDRASGANLSLVGLPAVSDLRIGLYRILGEDGRMARFVFQGEPGEIVSVTGSFDNWDPFIHEMRETAPGLYKLELPLPPGPNYYCFVYRGEMIPDPLNASRAVSGDGQVVSMVLAGD